MINMHNGLGTIEQQQKYLEEFENNGLNNIRKLKTLINTPHYNRAAKTLSLAEISALTGIPRTSIRDKEKSGDIKYDDKEPLGKTLYSLKDVSKIRALFKKGIFHGSINRDTSMNPIIMSVSMFKGGVGKTTHSTHLAAHLALQGLKVLLIDLDPQASASLVFGYIPSVDIESGHTILRSLVEKFDFIHGIIKPTYYYGLDIIPSGLELQSADLILPDSRNNNYIELGSPIFRLTKVLSLIKNNYDVIILDCPPNHGATTMNALVASNAVLIPVSPNMLSYGSSIQFIHTLRDLSQTLSSYKDKLQTEGVSEELSLFTKIQNGLFRILITNDPGDKEAQDVSSAIRSLYKDFVLPRPMCRTIALARAANDMGLIYDSKRNSVRGAKEAFDRGLYAMKAVNDDILTLFKYMWGINE
jgi:chromosome partitioning protein